jgi:hypothetical protein
MSACRGPIAFGMITDAAVNRLKIAGGVEAGDAIAPAVWDDEQGARRVCLAAANEGLSKAVVVGIDKDGELYVASDVRDIDAIIGLLYRGLQWLANAQLIEEPSPVEGPA